MTDFITLSAEPFRAPDGAAEPGPAPMLQWLKIADLVVDPSYQREIRGTGRRNVQAIAAAFAWHKFAPVVVAPIEGGKYAIIDGQHRATAALLRGFEQVPAQVVICDRSAQAAAFSAINGQTTRVTPQQVHAAAVAAQDPEALAIDEACTRAGVKILRYPVGKANGLKPGETLAAGEIRSAYQLYGGQTLETSLRCIVSTGEGNAGMVVRDTIRAFCNVFAAVPPWRDAGEALFDALDDFDLGAELARARDAKKEKGISAASLLQRAIVGHLSRRLGGEQLEAAE